MDFITVSLVCTVSSVPVRKGKDIFFSVRNVRGNSILDFEVFVRNDERPIDINEGDRIFIMNAGLYQKNGKNCLAVIESSTMEPIRKRCNLGEMEV